MLTPSLKVDLGISLRLKYGFLLKVMPHDSVTAIDANRIQNFTETNTIPVFRTESQ